MAIVLPKLRNGLTPAWAWLAALLCCASGSAARASDEPASAWVVVDAGASAPRTNNPAIPSPRFVLLHLPPRSGDHKAERGTVRIATWLGTPPLALASSGNRVYLVFPPVGGGEWGSRPVLSVAAEPVAGTWRNEPEGRLEALPSLPGEGELLGLGATPRGPVAVLRDRASGARRVLRSTGLAWEEIAGPWAGTAGGSADSFVQVYSASRPGGSAVGIIEWPDGRGGTGVIWEGTDKGGGRDSKELAWTRDVLDVSGLLDGRGERAPARRGGAWQAGVVSADGVRIAVDRRSEDGLRLWSIGQGPPMPFGKPESDMPPWSAVAAMEGGLGSPGVAVVWVRELKEGVNPGEGPVIEIREFGATTGLSMYAGVAKPLGAMSRRDIELLAVMVVVVMLGILMAAVRPDPRLPPALPDGYRVADPARRLMGTLIDAGVGISAAGWIFGIAPAGVIAAALGRGGSGGGEDDMLPILTAMGIAAGQAAMLEWLLGASIGKLFVGARVGRVVRAEGVTASDDLAKQVLLKRAKFWQAWVRNLVKWGAPPVTVFAMTDPLGRHPGDLAAGTLVLVRRKPEPPK